MASYPDMNDHGAPRSYTIENFLETPIASVLVSILNWNSAAMTLDCIDSLLTLELDPTASVDILVIDNGSAPADWAQLQAGVEAQPERDRISLRRETINHGFAGGHNIAIRMAMEQASDFIWLVNSDAVIDPHCLDRLLQTMQAHPQCGATSPVVVALDDATVLDFCGASVDWTALETPRATSLDQARAWEAATPERMWISGAVVLYRIAALREAGMLDKKLFAYYEDTELGVRLGRHGWENRMSFDARAMHLRYRTDVTDRPPYYFYLMVRNAILFWLAHTPVGKRRLLRLRLMDRSLFLANKLMLQGQTEKVTAALLGLADGLKGIGGAPNLRRPVPLHLSLLRRLLKLQHARHLRHG